jgi:transglutaminase-like putative cysteine protease
MCTSLALALASAILASPSDAPVAAKRAFEFSYHVELKDVPATAKKVRIWVPIPKSSPQQTIDGLKLEGPGAAKIADEPTSGNRIAYFEAASPGKSPLAVSLSFAATRSENRVDLGGGGGKATPAPDARYLRPDRLGIIDDTVRKMTQDAVGDATTPVEKARRIYQSVLEHMTYDKTGTGWGRGDTKFACTVGKGNCTDFHALFMSMCRSADIPCKFEIGFPLPADAKEGKIGGYHCWAYFFAPDRGWVPVDASEARKHPEMKGYFFGAHDSNRVTFTEGRDLVLVPKQDGDPVNFLVYPYVEIDGKPFDSMEKTFAFKDTSPKVASGG